VKLSDPNCEVETEYVDKLQALVDALARQGATIKEAEPQVDTTRSHEIYLTLLRAATSSRVTDDDIERWRKAQETLGPSNNRYLDLLLRGSTLSHREWLRLNNERHGLRRTFAAFFEDYDVLLCPVGASAAPPHNHEGETWQRTITVNDALDEPSVLGRLRDPGLPSGDDRSDGNHRVRAARRLPGHRGERPR
jgi:amidase